MQSSARLQGLSRQLNVVHLSCSHVAVMQCLQLLACVCRDQDGTAQHHSASPETEPHNHQNLRSSSSCAESRLQSPDREDLK